MKEGRDTENLALLKFEGAARDLGVRFERFYPRDVPRLRKYDAVLIRADTGARNLTYAVARMAEAEGIPVLDPSRAIAVCSNKIHMGRLLQAAEVPTPPTRYLLKSDALSIDPESLFKELGSPLVLKAPESAFSAYVEKVESVEEWEHASRRFLRRSDGLVAQAFTPTEFDWRVGIVGNRVSYVARYWMPKGAWRVFDKEGSLEDPATLPRGERRRRKWGHVEGVPIGEAPRDLLKVAKRAAATIGPGLFGVDVKQQGGEFLVIEVNDNPTILPGYEDQAAPHVWSDVVSYLMEAGIG